RIAQLGDKLRKLMQAGRQIEVIPVKDFDDALARAARGEIPEHRISLTLVCKRILDANNAAQIDPIALKSEFVTIRFSGPVATRSENGVDRSLLLDVNEVRDLAKFMDDVGFKSMPVGLERQRMHTTLMRFQQPGRGDGLEALGAKYDFLLDFYVNDKH